MRYRLLIEVEYIIMLSKEKKIKEFAPLSKNQKYNLRKLYKNFTDLENIHKYILDNSSLPALCVPEKSHGPWYEELIVVCQNNIPK